MTRQNRLTHEFLVPAISGRILELIRGASPETVVDEAVFAELAGELFAWQYEQVPVYRRWTEARGATPGQVTDWKEIPAVPTRAFQEFELTSLPEELRTKVFYSSGTTAGQRRSRHDHSVDSLCLYEASVVPWFAQHMLPELREVEGKGTSPSTRVTDGCLIALAPDAGEASNSSLVHMLATVREHFGFSDGLFAGQSGPDGSWVLDAERAVGALQAAVRTDRAVVLLGPAFAFVHLLDHIRDRGLELRLPVGSRAMETGGYKGRSRTVPRAELYELVDRHLGIPARGIVSEYGMSELSSQGYDHAVGTATRHVFQFPPWARVQVVSPETGMAVEEGGIGLLRIYDLANVYSIMAVQTEDLAVRRGRGFELLGRAADVDARGCSLRFD